MTRSLILQDFASAQPGPTAEPVAPSPAQMPDEGTTLEAYENGYKCGWADCAKTEAEERGTVGAELAKNLSEAELTFETARRDVIAALGPFFEDVAATLLPQMAAAALAPTVLAELGALAEDQTDQRIEIRAAPSACGLLERLGEEEQIRSLKVYPEPAFAEGQVSIRVGSERRDLDMNSAAARISEAIAKFGTSNPTLEPPLPAQGAA